MTVHHEYNDTMRDTKRALQWYMDMGIDMAVDDAPVDKTVLTTNIVASTMPAVTGQPTAPLAVSSATQQQAAPPRTDIPLGSAVARGDSIKRAVVAATLDALQDAIRGFDGLAVKKTATNMVFADGDVRADLMVIGEAPGADEDRIGKPFVGVSGQLLDQMLACIGLSRTDDDPKKSVYISNILNWRPPGNRTPGPAEIDVSLPFIERHIILAKPKMLLFVGGVAAKSLLASDQGISKLRGRLHEYMPQTPDLRAMMDKPIPAMATFHPSYLLRTPTHKRAAWQDLLALREKLDHLGQ